MDDQNRNLILATALSFLVILVWFLLFPPEEPRAPQPPAETTGSAETGTPPAAPATGPGTTAPTPPAAAEAPGATPAPTPDTEARRLAIETPRLSGSISLRGGRVDTLALGDYHETIDPDSPTVDLLAPVGSAEPYYALYGWSPAGDLGADSVPGPETRWRIEEGGVLTPDAPVTLVWDNGAGLIFRRTISVDDDYMFTVTQSVENAGGASVRLAPYGIVARHGKPDTSRFFILHEGVVRQNDDELQEISYGDMADLEVVARERAPAEIIEVTGNGWVGFTDKYWMTTMIPEPGQGFASVAKFVELPEGTPDIYQVETRLPVQEVAPGARAETRTMLFAGAKEWETIRAYEQSLGIVNFVDSIDWGWFFFLTKPIFRVLHFLNAMIGNMGWAIIGLTVFLKALLFPLAYKSYAAMARMRELQPEMEKIKERAGNDRQKLQQEMMALYKEKKVNPAAGCLPILLQIPIFFSLYKVIFVTIELRHAPWVGWIRDLSAPDPSSILNLFGLLPFAPPDPGSILSIISLGVLPIALGVSMWLQQKLNPTPTDPTQKMIFAWMPWVFMFMLGRFASGLVLYWITNNVITFLQQYIIMRIHGYKPDLLGNLLPRLRRRRDEGEGG